MTMGHKPRPRLRLWPRRWRHWSLRFRMVVATVALAAIALIVANVAGVALLRSTLIHQIDTQLEHQARASAKAKTSVPRRPSGGRHLPADSRHYRYSADGTLRYASPSSDNDQPRLGDFTALKARAGGAPFTVDGTEGDWRVKVSAVAGGQQYAVYAVSLDAIQVTEETLLLVDAAVTALVLLLIALAAASVVRIGLRPLTRMERIAAEIAGGNLSRRVGDADPHTESGRLGAALNVMLARIEGAIHARSASERRLRQFLADASHELRTPLTSIKGFAQLYRRGGAPPGPDLDDAMERVEAEVDRMHLLVNDLLLLARLDEERPVARQPVDLLAVAADAVRDAHLRAPSRSLQLATFDSDSEMFDAVTVCGDEPRIRQVVNNLLTNALQHTVDGTPVTIRVGRRPAGPDSDRCPAAVVVGADLAADQLAAAVEVIDAGPGMELVDAQHVFERFYRADASRSRRHGGTGLGLAIVAAIVQAHRGRVELRTAPGAGARFRVLLPLTEAAEPDATVSAQRSGGPTPVNS
jgi:two-component system, OmpR family, sensor kinase